MRVTGDRLAAAPPRRFAVLCLSGLTFGVVEAVVKGLSVKHGLEAAALYAVCFAVGASVAAERDLRALRGLTRRQQIAVAEAVDRGTVPDDPALSRSVLEQVAVVRRRNEPVPIWHPTSMALLAVALGLVAIAVLAHESLVLAVEGIVVALWQSRLKRGRSDDDDRILLMAELAERRARTELGEPVPAAAPAVAAASSHHAVASAVLVSLFVAVASLVTNLLPTTVPHPTTADRLRSSGYRVIGQLDGTTVWIHASGTTRISLVTLGAIQTTCEQTSRSGILPLGQDLCRGATGSGGTVFAYLGDNTLHGVDVELSDGTRVTQTIVYRLGTVWSRDRIALVLVGGRRVWGYPSYR